MSHGDAYEYSTAHQGPRPLAHYSAYPAPEGVLYLNFCNLPNSAP